MTAISPADGPVAVTGASGYIGSWTVQDLVEEGYDVRACVRDTTKPEKVDHLLLADRARIEPTVEVAQRQPCGDGKLVPVKVELQYRRLTAGRPGAATMRLLR